MCACDGHIYYVSLLFLESQYLQKHFIELKLFHSKGAFRLSSPNLFLCSSNLLFECLQMGSCPDDHLLFIFNPGCFLQVLLIHGSNLAARGFMLVVLSYSELAGGM